MSESDSNDDFPTQSISSSHDAAADDSSFESSDRSASLDATTNVDVTPSPSVRIGRYKLLQQIGEGGMGSVWMAQQESPVRRRVAIKLVRTGMDSNLVLARFEAERQALAMMEHANIATVFDAGTSDDGRPYFVMELVQGPPITKYCDNERLSTRDRLELFIPVCHAVHHAHQKGVIHRDLKPSNVMIGTQDGQPVPKVIDFGLAKAQQQQMQLTDKTLFTEFGQVVGTVQYMSPEQAVLDVQDIDTRSDIYSLGVLLYELLTGSTPIQRSSVSEMPILKVLSLVRDSEPPRPSDRVTSIGDSMSEISAARQTDSQRLKQTLSGDLDWIVMKALDKDRERRFGSAAEFAADIRRYLDDEPIEARPPSASYRIRKFTRKYRVLMSVTSTILLLLLAGIAGTTWFAIAAERSRETAVAEKERGDQETTRARDAEESAKQAAAMAKQETARAKAAEARADDQARRATEANELGQARLARSNYSLALASFRDDRTSRGYELLENIPERYRNFEWHYDYNHFQQSRLSFQPRQGPLKRLAVRPDGKWCYANGGDVFYLFDTETGDEIDLGKIKRKGVWHARWSTDGKLFGVLRWDRIDFHDGETLEFIKTFKFKSENFIFAPDGESFYTYHRAQVHRRSYATGEKIWSAKSSKVWARSIAVSEDGNQLAVGRGNGQVHLYDTDDESGDISLQFKMRKNVSWLAYSPDGSMLAVPTGRETVKVDLVNPNSGEVLKMIDTGNQYVVDAKFSPDGTRLLTAGENARVNLWDVATGELLKSFSEHRFPLHGICWTPDGTGFISSDIAGYVRISDVDPNDDDGILQQGAGSFGISIRNSDGLIAAGDGRMLVIRNAEGEVLRSVETHGRYYVQHLAFSPDGRQLAVARIDGVIAIWDPDTGELIRELKKHNKSVLSLAFTPDGSKLVTGSVNSQAFVWDVATGELLWSLEGHGGGIYAVDCSPNGKLIATASVDKVLQLWDASTGQRVLSAKFADGGSQRFQAKRIMSIKFSPDSNQIFAGTIAGLIFCFDCETGLEQSRFFGNSTSITTMTFSPDGSRLVTASSDQMIRIWDPETYEELRALNGHTRYIEDLCFNRDGSKLYSTSRDGTVRVWDATSSK